MKTTKMLSMANLITDMSNTEHAKDTMLHALYHSDLEEMHLIFARELVQNGMLELHRVATSCDGDLITMRFYPKENTSMNLNCIHMVLRFEYIESLDGYYLSEDSKIYGIEMYVSDAIARKELFKF